MSYESFAQARARTIPENETCGKIETFPLASYRSGKSRHPLPDYQQGIRDIVENRKNFFHLHLISDSTGETLMSAGRAATAQFRDAQSVEHVYPLVRSRKQLLPVLEAIDAEPGIVLYTIVDRELASLLDEYCRRLGLPSANVLEPVMSVFQHYLGEPSRRRASAQHLMNADYFARIEALNYAMDHDDGQLPEDYEDADVIILGVSRTSKTPTAIYLANRGVKTANIPIVHGVALPENLFRVTGPLIVGLIATSDRISQVRGFRELGSVLGYDPMHYTDRAAISEELKFARALCAKNNWSVIDVTRRSIEETAAAILALRPKLR